MRVALLLAVCCLVGPRAVAQGIYFTRTMVERAVSGEVDDVAAYSRVVNPGDAPVTVRWVREVNDLSPGWASAICDTVTCHPAAADTAEFAIPAGASAPIVPHVYPAGSGEAQLTVRVVNVADARDNAVATFTFPADATAAAAPAANPRAVNLYPNPSAMSFRLSAPEPLLAVRLTNMLGKVVKTFPGHLADFDVADVPNGIYLVSLVGADGRVLKTLRYSKRQVMP